MSASANRNTGYSRKAQYSTFFGYVAGVLGAVVGAGLLIYSMNDRSAFAGARALAADVTSPGAKASAEARGASHGIIATVRGYFLAGSRNAKLQRELDAAKIRLVEAQAIEEENRRLKAVLGIMVEEPKPVAVTMLTSSTASSTRRFATIAAGADQSVQVGMPVRSPVGLLGRVVEVGASNARIMLITDTESVVPVRRASDGIPAFAQGKGDGTIQIRLINLGINPIKKGDVFVTSGSGGLYRPNTAMGAVVQVTRDGAIARVLSDPAASEYVIVDQTWEMIARHFPPPEQAGNIPATPEATTPARAQ